MKCPIDGRPTPEPPVRRRLRFRPSTYRARMRLRQERRQTATTIKSLGNETSIKSI
jgi:hypothetical protein